MSTATPCDCGDGVTMWTCHHAEPESGDYSPIPCLCMCHAGKHQVEVSDGER
jgi:hypothetical protein